MLNSWFIAIPVAAALGFLSGIGTGGGSLLILWLTLMLRMTQEDARCINLLFFIPSALIACAFRWKQGNLNMKKLLPAVLAGCAGALLAGTFGSQIPQTMLKKLFGGLLIITGVRELLYRSKAGQ